MLDSLDAPGKGNEIKAKAAIYTQQKLNAARTNVQRYEWAAKMKERAVKVAEKYTAVGMESLWSMIVPQGVPRSYALNEEKGCPVCGLEVNKFGSYMWRVNHIKTPWKILCPNCSTLFPANDFEGYYNSGIDNNGVFDPAKADRKLLKNTMYPDKPEDWCVDDGYGWTDDKGNRWPFIAVYNHFLILPPGEKTEYNIVECLSSLIEAYLYTGDLKYANHGVIMLDRIADFYPDMDTSVHTVADGFRHSDGSTGRGKIVGAIWDCGLVNVFIMAYDAFFHAMSDEQCSDALPFLKSKARCYGLEDSKATMSLIKKNIEDNILRQVYPAVQKAQIAGNTGMHQHALASAAVVLGDDPATKEWIDWLFKPGTSEKSSQWGISITGGNILNELVCEVDRDGMGGEASPHYNWLWFQEIMKIADVLEYCEAYKQEDLYSNPKFRKMFFPWCHLIMNGKYIPPIADTGVAGKPGLSYDKKLFIKGFRKYQEPILAQLVYFLNGNSVEGLHEDIFTDQPEKIKQDILEVIRQFGELKLESENLTGYGFASLREKCKAGNDPTEAWIYYGRTIMHGHRDALNLGLYFNGLDMTPDLGYPEFCRRDWPHFTEWNANTISHNTVVVDSMMQKRMFVGFPQHFETSGSVKLIDIDAPAAYQQTKMYRRAAMMINTGSTSSYLVDFFHVNGGGDHYYSFHGAEGAITTEGLSLTSQLHGTYAGEAVEFEKRSDVLEIPTPKYEGSGFHFLFNVERDAKPKNIFSVDWSIIDTWKVMDKKEDIHLRLTMLGQFDDVALADGNPPRNKPGNPKTLRYLIAHRKGTDLKSHFVSVIELYKGNRYIKDIKPCEVICEGKKVDPAVAAAVRITLLDGSVDYVLHSLNSDICCRIDDRIEFKGMYGFYRESEGMVSDWFVCEGTYMSVDGSILFDKPYSVLMGRVEDFTRELSVGNEIIIKFDKAYQDIDDMIGKYVYVENEALRNPGADMVSYKGTFNRIIEYPVGRNAVYKIKGIKKKEGCFVTFDIGDTTPIKRFLHEDATAGGYKYDLEVGDRVRIPVAANKNNQTLQNIT